MQHRSVLKGARPQTATPFTGADLVLARSPYGGPDSASASNRAWVGLPNGVSASNRDAVGTGELPEGLPDLARG